MIQKKGMWCTATSIFNRSINSMLQGALEELRSVRDYLIDNYYTKQEVDAKDATHYTKDEADDTFVKKEELNNYPTNDEVKDLFKNYYTKSEIDKLLKNYNPNPNPGGETMTEQDVQTLIDNSLSNYVTNTQFSELSSTVTNNQSAMADIQRWQVEQMIPFVQQQALVKQDFFYIAGSKGDAKIPFSTITNKITNDGSIGQGNHDVVLVEKSVTTLPNFYNKTESDNKYMPINADGGWLTEDNIGDILVNYVTTDWEFLINDTGIADDHKDCDFNGLSDYVLVDIRALSNFYNKSEIDTKLANISTGGSVDLDGYLKKTEAESTYASKNYVNSSFSEQFKLKIYQGNSNGTNELVNFLSISTDENTIICDNKAINNVIAFPEYIKKTTTFDIKGDVALDIPNWLSGDSEEGTEFDFTPRPGFMFIIDGTEANSEAGRPFNININAPKEEQYRGSTKCVLVIKGTRKAVGYTFSFTNKMNSELGTLIDNVVNAPYNVSRGVAVDEEVTAVITIDTFLQTCSIQMIAHDTDKQLVPLNTLSAINLYLKKTDAANTYATKTSLDNYTSKTSLTDTLKNYVTNTAMSSYLSGYVATAALTNILDSKNYINSSELDNILLDYLKTTDLTNKVKNIQTKIKVDDNYVTNTSLVNTESNLYTPVSASYVDNKMLRKDALILVPKINEDGSFGTKSMTFADLTNRLADTNYILSTVKYVDDKIDSLSTGGTSVDLSNYYTKTDCDNNFITSDTAFCYVDGDGGISGDALLNSIDEYTLASKDYVDNQIIEATIDETTLNTKINDIVTSKNLVTTTTLNSYYTSTQVDSKVTDLGVKIDNINSKIANVTTASVINLSVEAVTSNNYMVVKNNSDPDNVVSISSPDITIVPKPNNSVVYTINGTKLSDISSFIYINPNAAYKTAGTFTLIVNLADTSTAVISLNIWSDATNVVYYNNSIYSKDNSLYTFKKGFSTIVTMDVLTNQITIKELPILAQVQDVNKITEQQLVDLLKNTPDNCIRLVGNNNQSDLNLQKNNISDSSCTITSKLSSSGIWYTDVQFSDSNYILKEGAFATKVKTALGVGNIVDTFAPYDNSYVFFSLITKVLLFKVTNCTGAELGCHLFEPDAACKIYLPNTSDNTFSDDFIGSINSNINNITTANIILY